MKGCERGSHDIQLTQIKHEKDCCGMRRRSESQSWNQEPLRPQRTGAAKHSSSALKFIKKNVLISLLPPWGKCNMSKIALPRNGTRRRVKRADRRSLADQWTVEIETIPGAYWRRHKNSPNRSCFLVGLGERGVSSHVAASTDLENSSWNQVSVFVGGICNHWLHLCR